MHHRDNLFFGLQRDVKALAGVALPLSSRLRRTAIVPLLRDGLDPPLVNPSLSRFKVR